MENPRVLGVSVYRPDEIVKPIENLEGSKTISVDHSKPFVKKYLSTFIHAKREISTGKYDAVIVNSCGLISFLISNLCLIYRTPLIIRLIGNYWQVSNILIRRSLTELNFGSFIHILFRTILSRASFIFTDGYLVVSENLVKAVEKNTGTCRENISVVHYPIDFDKFASGNSRNFIEQHQIKADRILSVVFHAEFHPKYQGFKDVISLADNIISEYPDTCLVVAGWGEHYNKLSRHFNNRQIHFVGFIDNMPGLYAASDILLYNSYMDGYPNVILEAQAAGVPVISNPRFGMSEQINHLDTGILAQINGQYENYLRDSLDGKINLEELAQNARQSVREHNSPESISLDLSCAVKGILKNK